MENFKEKNKSFSIKLKPSLMEQVEDYITLVNKTKTDKEPKFKKVDFFNNILSDYFQHIVLTKDFIELDKDYYYYFNKKELFKNGTVKTVHEKPSSSIDIENSYTVKRIPNNLDSFNAEFNSYCYENDLNKHKGVYIHYLITTEVKPVPLVFDFNDNELTISLIKLSDIPLLIDNEEDVKTIKNIIDYSSFVVENYEEYIVKPEEKGFHETEESFNFYKKFIETLTSVIEPYKMVKKIDLTVKYKLDVLGKPSSEELIGIDLNNPIKDLVNSNVAKDKEIKELNEFKNRFKDIDKDLKEIKDSITWKDVMNEY